MAEPAPHLVDEILEEIFLRLPTPAALARASTASPHFHSIITERSFLRRFRKLHPPPLLGFIDKDGFHPAEAPHPSAPLARAFADAADFTYSFIPKLGEEPWIPRDARDGRVLLQLGPFWNFRNLAVCDPLSRRYVLIPPIPEDLAVQEGKRHQIQYMLLPIAEDEGETSFKVICPACYESKMVAFVFSSVTGNWCIAASISWSSLGTVQPDYNLSNCNYLHGRFYWIELWSWRDKLLVLDTRSMEFSTINFLNGYHAQLMDLPDVSIQESNIVAGGGEEVLEMFSLIADQSRECSFAVHHTIQQINDESFMEWRLEKIIPVPHYYCFTSSAAEGFLFFGATTYTEDELRIGIPWSRTHFEEHYCSLEVQTSKITEICRKMGTLSTRENIYWYFGFPPLLSEPSI